MATPAILGTVSCVGLVRKQVMTWRAASSAVIMSGFQDALGSLVSTKPNRMLVTEIPQGFNLKAMETR